MDINTQQSFEALNARLVSIVIDPVQSVKAGRMPAPSTMGHLTELQWLTRGRRGGDLIELKWMRRNDLQGQPDRTNQLGSRSLRSGEGCD